MSRSRVRHLAPGKPPKASLVSRSNQRTSLAELSGFKVMEWLFWLRNLMIIAQLFALWVAVEILGLALPLRPLIVAPALLLLFNLLVYWRLEKGESASDFEITLHLLFDMLVFTWLLYWTGGSANPFVSAYLVPVAMAAAFASFHYALALGVSSVLLYSFLMFSDTPLPPMNGHFGSDFSLHVFGMWLSFLMSAAISIVFISGLAHLARRRARALRQAEQESINSQHLVALGALAAGAAHELGTPLSNIAMLADELVFLDNDAQQRLTLVDSLKQQLGLCQSQLDLLREQAHQARNPEIRGGPAEAFIHGVLERFKAMRSDMLVKVAGKMPRGNIDYDAALSQTLLNLLNNAADASASNNSEQIEISFDRVSSKLKICIDDFGAGLSEDQLALIGSVPFSTKHTGMGIGLLLSRANIDHLGGSLRLYNRGNAQNGGVRTEVMIPMRVE